MYNTLVLVKSSSGKDPQYTSAVARIRIFETRLVSRASYERMIEADTFNQALKILSENYDYRHDIEKCREGMCCSPIFTQQLRRMYELLSVLVPNSLIPKAFMLRYDIINIKILQNMAQKTSVRDPEYVELGFYGLPLLKECTQEGNYDKLDKKMSVFAQSLEKMKGVRGKEIQCDTFFFSLLEEAFKSEKSPFLNFIFSTMIDTYNIKSLFRINNKFIRDEYQFEGIFLNGGMYDRDYYVQLIGENETEVIKRFANTDYDELVQNLFDLEKKGIFSGSIDMLFDNFLMNLYKEAKTFHFGVEPIVGYIFAKENEVKHLRRIFTGKQFNLKKNLNIIERSLESVYA